MDLEMAWSK